MLRKMYKKQCGLGVGGRDIVQLSMGSLSLHARLCPTAASCWQGGQESNQPAALSVLLEASVLLRLLVPMPRMPATAMLMVLGAQARMIASLTTGLGAASEHRACTFPASSLQTAGQAPDNLAEDGLCNVKQAAFLGPALHSGPVCMATRPARTLLAISCQEGSVAGAIEGQAKVRPGGGGIGLACSIEGDRNIPGVYSAA